MRATSTTRIRVMAAGVAAAGVLVAAGSSGPALAGTPPSAGTAVSGTGDCDSVATCYTPGQLRAAYGIQPLTDRGIDGRGETVVIPALAESRPSPPVVSDLRRDMAGFDKLFGLPAPRMRVVTTLAGPASPWLSYGEETLDAEMVHAIAPRAGITVVLLKPADLATPAAAAAAFSAMLKIGVASGDVISISAGWGERCFTKAEAASLHAALRQAAARHVTVVAGTGDIGPVSEPCDELDLVNGTKFPLVAGVALPASDPLVLAAGGTTLDASHRSGTYLGETAWGLPYGTPGTAFQASGGGYSRLYARPGYQGRPVTGTARGVPDVSADANGHTGMALVTGDGSGGYTISGSGGTSAAAPFWAGVIALADQYAGHDLGFVNPALYRIAGTAAYRTAFHDVTAGSNTVEFLPRVFIGYWAARGWDTVTGLGSPDARLLVPLLARRGPG